MASHSHLHLVAFVCSLSAKQQALLMREQVDLDSGGFLFFSEDFESRVKSDVVQFHLFKESNIWRVPRSELLIDHTLPLTVENLRLPDFSLPPAMLAKEKLFLQKLQEVPGFIETLTESQERILVSVVRFKLPLQYFFVAINERQLTDFSAVHKNL